MSEYAFPYETAETTFMSLVRQREVIRGQPGFDPTDPQFLTASNLDIVWATYADEVYEFSTRTPLAAVLTGLLARASDGQVDPLSLQDNSGPHGFSATRLWNQAIRRHAQGTVHLNKLKDQPFNNSPFNGQRRVGTTWENTSSASKKYLKRVTELLALVDEMSPDQAQKALLSFLVAAPDPPQARTTSLDEDKTLSVSLVDFADAVQNFILLNSDDGRRAQAFVTACVEVALPGRTTTPESVNDPSRTAPGDVKSHAQDDPKALGPLFIEVKDKIVMRTDVVQFVKEVAAFDRSASAGYAALSNNADTEANLPSKSRVPDAEPLTREFGIPVLVWRSPLELLSQSAAWSALAVPRFLALCADNYLKWLEHIDTGKNNSPQEWKVRLNGWGLFEDPDAPPRAAANPDGTAEL